ncbi:MAG: WecB/TagA/CpsF family glycosyltransferase [Spirochaetes bacterium]|nr:WecB/TagA/CpsF family glycosyltransferase [Spirochaetota bacterium]
MERLDIFGIGIIDTTLQNAKDAMESIIDSRPDKTYSIVFVNTSTMNLAIEDRKYADVLNSADYVFGDGTGVRWAVRILYKRKLLDNVNGTDLIPKFLRETTGKNYRYFLLGAEPEAIEKAAENAPALFPDCALAGYHHGFWKKEENDEIIRIINESGAHLLLVGMGNPIQENWIAGNIGKLKVPLVAAVGGLFTYWSGDLDRAPLWIRKIGMEWLHILFRQPHKWQRYLVGNTKFLARIFLQAARGKS